MKKIIISVILSSFIILLSSFNVYADDVYKNLGLYDDNPTLSEMRGLVKQELGWGASKYYIYYTSDSYNSYNNVSFYHVINQGYVFYPVSTKTKVCSGGHNCNYANFLIYNSSSDTYETYDSIAAWVFQYNEGNGGQLIYQIAQGFYLHEDNSICLCDYNDSLVYVPIASSLENAITYSRTGNINYLSNSELFSPAPEPNSLVPYLDVENDRLLVKFDTPSVSNTTDLYNVFITRYYYIDDSGEEILYSSTSKNRVSYRTSASVPVALEFLNDYDNSFVEFTFWNEYDNDDGIRTSNDSISVRYYGNDVYYIDHVYNYGPDVPDWSSSKLENYVEPNYDEQNSDKLDGVLGFLTDIKNGIVGLGSDIASGFSNLGSSISDGFSSLIDGIASLPELIWSSIKDGLVDLFVPDEEYIKTMKVNWESLLSSRFGAVYQSFQFLVDFVSGFTNQTAVSTITFPSVTVPLAGEDFTFGGYEVSLIPDGFQTIVDILKSLISLVCTIAFVNAMKSKLSDLLGGKEDVN